MRNNETGEFELVVGNKQLLSAFFIVVLLFAVAFAMGYIFGQNSPRSARLPADASQAPAPMAGDQRPQPVAPAPAAEPPAAPPDSAAPAPAGAETGEAAAPPVPQPTTQPARESPAAAAPPPAPAPQTATPPAKVAPKPQPATPPPAPAPVPAAPAAPGSYWQVMAVNPAEAQVVAKALKDKGFPASTAPGPNNLLRVLVGPYSDTQAMGRAKTQLESAGFHPIRK